jgi:hypothetical protein
VAAGFESGAYVYDVSDPAAPQLLAEWDLTPDCLEDWYGHTVDTVIRDGRRYLTLTAELFDFGPQSEGGQRAGCGQIVGNADKVGPLWIIDATDLSALGPAEDNGADNVPALKAASQRALVATWTNPARRAAGHLRFSPHNQQVFGNRILLSHYHGGVYVLDASFAFRGRSVRPREVAFVVPHGDETRPIYRPAVPPASPFFGAFLGSRPTVWDAIFYKDHVIAADWHGGLYSFRVEPEPVCVPNLPGPHFIGTPGRDVLTGTAGPDVICGGGGKDSIRGRGGDDVLIGGRRRDRLIGARGNDLIRAGAARDLLRGGGGSDRLLGGPGRDVLDGGGGSDLCSGGSGRPSVLRRCERLGRTPAARPLE